MIASELLSEVVPSVHKNDLATEALNWMDVFKVSHLPVVEDKEYLGLISDADIYDLNNPKAFILDHQLSLPRPFIKENQHIFEVVELVSKHKLTVIPILDENEAYLGLITVNDLAQEISHLLSVENPGGIIVLEVKTNDYSLSEIAQIIESNDTKILSLYVKTIKTTDKINVTIKVNHTDISAVIQTFERYNYKIKDTFSDNNKMDSTLKDRLDSFFNYLNV
ncbi:MAG: CBS domain-containing protein [Salinivirgaceae bacterium]|jgi:acetoin utilization protein AcuB|nr:CBS domain-containing protein [Salinivirgaceae bacterium]